jgi:putative membrane protein
MRKFIWKTVANICVLYLLSLFMPQVVLQGAFPAILAGVLLSLLSITLRPLLMLLCLPLNLVTLGLFVLVINTWMLQLTDLLVKGFVISGFWYAMLAALFIMLANKLIFNRRLSISS